MTVDNVVSDLVNSLEKHSNSIKEGSDVYIDFAESFTPEVQSIGIEYMPRVVIGVYEPGDESPTLVEEFDRFKIGKDGLENALSEVSDISSEGIGSYDVNGRRHELYKLIGS